MSCGEPRCASKAIEALEFKASLVDYAQQAIIVTDAHGVISYWNRYATKMYGWEADEVIGRSIMDITVATHTQAQADEIMSALRSGRSWQGRFEVRRKDGSTFTSQVFDAPLIDEHGELVGIIGVSDDISEQLRAEDTNLELHGRLQQVQKLESIGRLAGGVAHDMNNLLTGVMTYASLVRDDPSSPAPIVAHAAAIHEQCERGRQLTRNLLGLARRGKYHVEDIDLRELIGQTTELLGRSVAKRIRLREEFEPGTLIWRGDRTQLHQLVMNLCINAVDALGPEGELRLRAVREHVAAHGSTRALGLATGDYVRLDVIDDGRGMDEATRAHALEPFFTTKPDGQGTGLGLPMAFGTAKNHGGALAIDSAEGVGTTVSVWIPVMDADAERPEAASSSPPMANAAILLVDDEPIVRAAAMLVLEDLGYEVVSAQNGREAVDIFEARAHEFALVLLDLIMPEMNGAEAFHALRAIDSMVPIVLTTGHSEDEVVAELVAAGAIGVLRKPFDAGELADAVELALSKTG